MRTALVVLALAAGCAPRADPNRFIPTPTVARTALTACLEAWKAGRPTGALAGMAPAVQYVDELRPQGQRLLDYEILGEVPGRGPRTFTVALETADRPGRKSARYVVVGIDPLWVFRQEDFDKMAHWEMDMTHDEPAEVKAKEAPQ